MKALSPWTASLLRASARVLTTRDSRRSLLVLLFHRVLPEPDPLLPNEPDLREFTAQIDITRAVCTVLHPVEAIERLFSNSLPANAACITFDDGYANNATCAASVLEARGLTATIFIASGFLGAGRMWNDTVIESVRRARDALDLTGIGLGRLELPDMASRRRAVESLIERFKYLLPNEREKEVSHLAQSVGAELPRDLMLSEAQVKELVRRGFDVGSHTISHPILKRLAESEARREIETGKGVLEDITGAPVRLFAYPNGHPGRDYERPHVEMVRNAGFLAAVSTAWGACRPDSDRFQLPRMRPWESSSLGFAGRLIYSRRERDAISSS